MSVSTSYDSNRGAAKRRIHICFTAPLYYSYYFLTSFIAARIFILASFAFAASMLGTPSNG